MKKLLIAALFLLAVPVHAQVFSQNQIIIQPFNGFVYSSSTSNGAKLGATSTPFFSSINLFGHVFNSFASLVTGLTPFGQTWEIIGGYLTPTTTIPIAVNGIYLPSGDINFQGSNQHVIAVGAMPDTDTAGSALNLNAGQGNGVGSGGTFYANAGNGGDTGNGGIALLNGGNGGGVSGNGGDAYVQGGTGTSGTGGNVILSPGNIAGSAGKVKILDSITGFSSIFNTGNVITSDQTFSFPDETGTFALGSGSAGNCASWSTTHTLTTTGSPCGSGSGSGIGTVATSSQETKGQIAVWGTTNGYPARLYSVATSTVSNGTGISVTAGQSIIGSGLTITNTGVTSNVAGTGINVSGATGAVTISNTGLLSLQQLGGGTAQTGAITFATSTTAISNDWGITNIAGAFTFNLPTATAAIRGLLSAADWTAFNAKQAALSFVYPLVNTANSISLAFGTTTSNTWAGTQTFTNSPVFSTLGAGTVNSATGGTLYNTSTSTPTATAPITYSGTLGQFIGGISGAFDCITATGSVKGCLAAADWTSFNNKISSTSLSATAPIRYVPSTGVFSWFGLATTSQPASSNLLVSDGLAGVYGVATSSATCSGSVSCSPFTVVGSVSPTITSTALTAAITSIGPVGQTSTGPVITLATSTSVTNGLTSALTIVGSGATMTFTPSQSGTLTVPGGGTGIGTFTSSQLLYGNGTAALSSVATGTASCTTGASCTSFTVIGSSPSITTTLGTSVDLTSEVTGTLPLANGGTATSTPGLEGQNVYVGPSGTSYIATSTIFTSTASNVGIGTTSPYAKLAIGGNVVIGAATAGGTLGDLFLPKLGTAAGTFLAVDPTGKVIATTTPSGSGTNYFTNASTLTSLSTGQYLAVPTNGAFYIGTNQFAYGSTTNHAAILGTGAGGKNATTSAVVNDTTAIGYNALNVLTTGVSNTGIGSQALGAITDGLGNTAVGWGAMTVTGGSVTLNTAIGASSLSSALTGSSNTAVGYQAGGAISSGSNNIVVGKFTTVTGISSGSNNISIGTDAGIPTATASNQLVIGNFIYGTGLSGTGATVSSGKIGIGSTSPYAELSLDAPAGTAPYFSIGSSTQEVMKVSGSSATFLGVATTSPWRTLSVTGTVGFDGLTASAGVQSGILCLSANKEVINDSVACVASSRRFKDDIAPLSQTSGLAELMQLQPVSFKYKPEYNGALQSNPNYNGEMVGFIAEDVQKIDPRLVVLETEDSKPGDPIISKKGEVHSVRYEQITAIIVKAVQEIVQKDNSQDAEIATLKSEIAALKAVREGYLGGVCHL